MNEQQIVEKDLNVIKRTFLGSNDYEQQFLNKKSSSKAIFLLAGFLIIVLTGIFFLWNRMESLVGDLQPAPTPSPVVAQMTSAPNPLVRSGWSFEVLNGSGESGLAKKIAIKIQSLGYQVVKIGNADKSNYSQSEIFIKKDNLDKIDLVIADLKEAVKIASVAGQLEEGTASARIIVGKDSI